MIKNPVDVVLSPVVAFDLETSGLLPWSDKIDLIALKTAVEGYVIEVDKYPKEWLVKLFQRIATECTAVIAYNAKFDGSFVWCHYGVLLKNLHCAQISAEMCENGTQKELKKRYKGTGYGPYALVSVLERWLGVRHANQKDKEILQDSFIDPVNREEYKKIPSVRNRQIAYAYEDVDYLIDLYDKELIRLEEGGLNTVYKLEHKLLPVLIKMETHGCLIDKMGWLGIVKNVWEPELKEIENALDKEVSKLITGRKFAYSVVRNGGGYTQFGLFGDNLSQKLELDNELNYSSTDQLLELFKALNEQPPTDDKGKPSLEEGYLSVYLTEHPDSPLAEFIRLLVLHRGVAKKISTYGTSFLAKLDERNYVHTNYTQTKTETGRLSSRSPNLQNIPKAPKASPELDVRRFFIAPPGYKFIKCDMDAAEVRIAADYSQEPILLDSLTKGVDMHSALASISYSIIFNQDVKIQKEGTITINGQTYTLSDLRDEHKSVVFAKFYKGGAKRVYGVLAEYINKHCAAGERMKISKAISDALDLKMPVLSEYLSKLIVQGRRDGYLVGSKLGRTRALSSKAYGECANFPIQNTNAEAIKIAMVNMDRFIEDNGLDAAIVLNIHDELCMIARDDQAQYVADNLKRIMAESLSYFLTTIKGGATVKIAQSW